MRTRNTSRWTNLQIRIQLFAVAEEFTGDEVFALATACIIGVVVSETQEAQVIKLAVRGITVDVSELPLFFTHIAPKPEESAQRRRDSRRTSVCVSSLGFLRKLEIPFCMPKGFA